MSEPREIADAKIAISVMEQIVALKAENEQLAKERDALARSNARMQTDRALAERAGGMKVKAHDILDSIKALDDAGFGDGPFVFDSRQELKEFIFALTTEPAAPEGRPDDEPVAWVRKWNFRGTPCADEFTDNADLAEQWRTHPQTNEVIPLYTRPGV